MKQREMNSKDLLLCFLYSPGQSKEINEAIIGRTKLMKMMFLFEKEIYPLFFEDTLQIQLPEFRPYYFGPFCKQLFDDLSFFVAIGLIVTSETTIPLSSADKIESEDGPDELLDDEWSVAMFDDENAERFELSYALSKNGVRYVEENVWNLFSEYQKELLMKFKAQINRISLDALLQYVYNKYPEEAVNSMIADKYLKRTEKDRC